MARATTVLTAACFFYGLRTVNSRFCADFWISAFVGGTARLLYMSQPPAHSGPVQPVRRFHWVFPESVRRSDLLSLQIAGPPPGPLPGRHGGDGDPRYPSPRQARRAVAFAADVMVHLVIAVGATAAVARLPAAGYPLWWPAGAFVGAYAVASFAHRVLLQAAFHATAGKALTGLRVIRDDDGRPPGVAVLLLTWLACVVLVALN